MDLFLSNLLTPMVLCYLLGLVAGGLGSDLRVPKQFYEAITIYLLFAIGFKGGVALSEAGVMDRFNGYGKQHKSPLITGARGLPAFSGQPENQVMEVILVQGPASKLQDIADDLITLRGIVTGRLELLAAVIPPLHPLPDARRRSSLK